MLYWLEDVRKCPVDGHKFIKPNKVVSHSSAPGVLIALYACPSCKNKFLEYPGARVAAGTDTSTSFLSYPELTKIEAIKKEKKEQALQAQRAAWAAKQEKERLEKLRIEEQKKREQEAKRIAEEERKRKMLSEYTTDELYVSDKVLFGRALAILKKLYGENAQFRPGQYEAIERTIKEKRLLVVQKTGWGKSLVYFICTKLLREDGAGVTLVISPLLALMENQLSAARKMGLSCAVLNSTLSPQEKVGTLEFLAMDMYDLVLTTPEFLNSKKAKEYLPDIKIGLLVIDEAHCISDWGHDFRLEYNKIYKVIEQLQPNVPVLATTATANNVVIEDLSAQMGVPNVSRGHLMRNNLSVQVLKLPEKETRYGWILDNLPQLDGTGIIYCLSKKDCSWLADFLQENGITAKPYFSGNAEQEESNRATLESFLKDEIKVIVSTIKLGMGFDKGNVAFVIHFQCPKNVIAYYQQIGRAGRSIPFARTFLMLGTEDFQINRSFIETAFPSESDMKRIRQFITSCKPQCTMNKLCSSIDLPKKRIQKALDFLEDGGLIEKQWRTSNNGISYATYKSTPEPFVYRREHYEGIKAIRYKEIEQMQAIAETETCISRAIVSCLDDVEDHDCGVCANCDESSRFPTEVSALSLRKAKEYLQNLIIPIVPWTYWPYNRILEDRKNYYPNITGIALSKYNEGIGLLVKEGKYNTGRFDDRLVRKGVHALKKYLPELQPSCITSIPSQNSDVVPDYAKRLAVACGLPYVSLLKKKNYSHQKDMNNPSHQFENAFTSFELLPGVDVPSSVILVDDMVDSGLTLAVCGAILGQNGCERVFPLALADSSSSGKDDEDD